MMPSTAWAMYSVETCSASTSRMVPAWEGQEHGMPTRAGRETENLQVWLVRAWQSCGKQPLALAQVEPFEKENSA